MEIIRGTNPFHRRRNSSHGIGPPRISQKDVIAVEPVRQHPVAGWNVPPPERLSVRFDHDKYGSICREARPQLVLTGQFDQFDAVRPTDTFNSPTTRAEPAAEIVGRMFALDCGHDRACLLGIRIGHNRTGE